MEYKREYTEEETLVLEIVAELIANILERTKSKLKENAFSMLAHDLRSPILTVMQLLGLFIQGVYGPVTSKQQQILGDLKDDSDLLLGLINDVLDVCRYETGRLVLGKAVIDLPKIIQQSVSLLWLAAADKKVDIETRVGPNMPHLIADEKRIMRVLINLLDNAIRFSSAGEKVEVYCDSLSISEALVTVTDVGPGVPAAKQPAIFDKFYQVRGLGTQDTVGAGLGLTFCRETVHAHGGKIWVESPVDESGRGCRFCFTLPVSNTPMIDQ